MSDSIENLQREEFYDDYVLSNNKTSDVDAMFKVREKFNEFIFQKFIQPNYVNFREIRVFEIGCGAGVTGKFLKTKGIEDYKGVDISEDQIKFSEEIVPGKCSLKDLSIALPELEDDSIDVFYAIDIFEHLSKKQILWTLSEFRRILKKGGICICQTPNADGIFFSGAFYSDFTHITPLNLRTVNFLANKSGLSIHSICESGPYQGGLKSYIRIVLWKLLRLVFAFIYAVEVGDFNLKRPFTRNFKFILRKR